MLGTVALATITASVILASKKKTLKSSFNKLKDEYSKLEQDFIKVKKEAESSKTLSTEIVSTEQKGCELGEQVKNTEVEQITESQNVLLKKQEIQESWKQLDSDNKLLKNKLEEQLSNHEVVESQQKAKEVELAWATHEKEVIPAYTSDLQLEKEIAEHELLLSERRNKELLLQNTEVEQITELQNVLLKKQEIQESWKQLDNDNKLLKNKLEEQLSKHEVVESQQKAKEVELAWATHEKEVIPAYTSDLQLEKEIAEHELLLSERRNKELLPQNTAVEQITKEEAEVILKAEDEKSVINTMDCKVGNEGVLITQEKSNKNPEKEKSTGIKNNIKKLFQKFLYAKKSSIELNPDVKQRIENIGCEHSLSEISDSKKEALNLLSAEKLDAMSDSQIVRFLDIQNGQNTPVQAVKEIEREFTAEEIKKISDAGYPYALIDWAYDIRSEFNGAYSRKHSYEWLKFLSKGSKC